jgi:hypothetical protein
MLFGRCWLIAAVSGGLLFMSLAAFGQDLGHKVPGLLGLDAGTIPEPGLYLVNRGATYQARELRGANGNVIPLGAFYFRASANELGLTYTRKLSWGPLLTVGAGAPISRLKLNVPDLLEAGVDRFGFGDVYVQPVGLGWRHPHTEVVTSYGIYIPTGKSVLAGGQGLSSGEITHEFSLGGSKYLKDRTMFLTGLASYQLYQKQRGIDVTRGDAVQVQGGAGIRLLKQFIETGVASYALWQVRDHRGTGLPPALRTGRDRVYGAGPEVAVLIPPLRGQLRVRYEWDLRVQARPQGHLFVADLFFLIHKPKNGTPTP